MLILALGYVVLALAVILVCTDATSLYLAHKRVEAVADAAALAGADSYSIQTAGDAPRAGLSDVDVRAAAQAVVAASGAGLRLTAADTPDGTSARVSVAGVWHPPVLTVFVPHGVTVSAQATSRTAFR